MIKTYHNDDQLKERAIASAIWHRQQDKLKREQYWDGERGCAIGCHAHHLNNKAHFVGWRQQQQIVADGYGWPIWLVDIEDFLFESMTRWASALFPELVCRAVPVGVDLARARFLLMVELLEIVLPYANEKEAEIIKQVQLLCQRAGTGEELSEPDWEPLQGVLHSMPYPQMDSNVLAVVRSIARPAWWPDFTFTVATAVKATVFVDDAPEKQRDIADRIANKLLELLAESTSTT